MGWSAIIMILIQVLGPILVDWFKKLLDKWLKKASEGISAPETFGDPATAMSALFDQAVAQQPKRAFARRAALRVLRRIAVRRAVSIFDTASKMSLPETNVDVTAIPTVTNDEMAEAKDAIHCCK